jgi:hypothetical protein
MTARATTLTLLGLVAAGLGWACRHDAPTGPTAVSRPSLAAGTYLLTFDTNVGPDAERACADTRLATTGVTIPVRLAERPGGWQAHPEGDADQGFSARFDVAPNGTGLGGTMAGGARDPVSGVVVTIGQGGLSPSGTAGPAAILGAVDAPRTASGSLQAVVRLTLDGLARECLVSRWRLEGR